ncbi:MAG: NAD(P)H-dependent oxidoreductase [Pseudomonadota bacterium]
MSSKRILVLDGHPAESSLSRLFAEAYAEAAKGAGHDARLRRLAEMSFDPVHEVGGYASNKPLEPVLEETLADLEWCGHLVLCAPMWWGTVPAKLKGLFDRAFVPGRTFDTRETTWIGMPKPMLAGRTARVIMTADTPGFFLRLAYGNAVKRQLTGQVLGFVGFKPVRFDWFAPASDPKPGKVEAWLAQVRASAARGD